MEKKSWWKRKSSDRSPGETESSTSISSHSESNSDEKVDHDSLQKSQSSEVTSRVSTPNTETNDSFKNLTEKLSAALVNVGAKEDLVKQHAKVAEEAVAGWEKAENEVTTLKQQLEAALQQNLALEVRTNHLDGALKECVKQLRQAREEQEQRINEALEDKKHEWELTKKNLEMQICTLKAKSQVNKSECSPVDPKIILKLETLEKENSALKSEIIIQSEELEIRTIERDLSTQAAESASKQQLESIKKVAKLEAECRKLTSLTRKLPSVNDNNHKAVSISSFYVDSLTDSQSDRSEKLDVDSFKVNKSEHNENDDSWALALIAELDQFKSGKSVAKNVEISNIMDDFLEMERIASLSEAQNETSRCNSETEDMKSEVEVLRMRVCELEEKLEELEAEKGELESALNASKESLDETKSQMVDLQKELMMVNESKKSVESRLVDLEMEARIISSENDSIKEDIKKERILSSEMTIKCQRLEKEVMKKSEEFKLQQSAISNGELKVKQDLEVAAADRLSECQKTISSLARQLESLATLEDFLIDTANLPGFSNGSSVTKTKTGVELWKLHSNDTFMPKKTLLPAKEDESNCSPSMDDESPGSSSSSSSTSSGHSKSNNSFEKLFLRSKNGVQGESHQG
ncbi:hypothetical protein Lser_V15G31237 [Lactuca serriola]